MERKKASDFHPEVLGLFDQYVHGLIDRRAFLARVAKFTVGGMTASMLLDALNPKFAEAQQVAKDDSRLKASTVEFGSPKGSGKMRGYFARPAKAQGKLPGILVIHENRGLNPHIEDIARRIALENYVAFAPDALTPLGGYPGDEDKARELFAKLDQAKTREDFRTALAFLEKRQDQGPAPHPLRGAGRPHQRRHPRLRAGAQGQQGEVPALHLSGHAARFQQRHHPALRQGGGGPGLEAHHGLLRAEPAQMTV
jgi:Dienelactone hydrolase family